jgi:hypothetical protein
MVEWVMEDNSKEACTPVKVVTVKCHVDLVDRVPMDMTMAVEVATTGLNKVIIKAPQAPPKWTEIKRM